MTSVINQLLEPQSVVIVGASDDPTRIGGRPLYYLIRSKFQGEIFVVNPNRAIVQGITSFPSIESLPAAADIAIIALPAKDAVKALADCAHKGIRTAIIFSAGFSETGEAGCELQLQISAICKATGIRVLGPNCLGVFNSHIGFFGTFTTSLTKAAVEPGALAIVSQSGACGGHLAYLCAQRSIGIGHWITTGNEVNIDLSECLLWLVRSEKVRVIAIYIESIRDGSAFVQALREAKARHKEIIILKVGHSSTGARAAASHTGALAGEDKVYDAVFRQYGAYRAHSIEEMLDVVYASLSEKTFSNNRLAVVTVSGGIGVQIADSADDYSIELPILNSDAQAQIKALIPFAATTNPIDVTAQLTNTKDLLERCLVIILNGKQFGSVLCFLTSAPANPAFAESTLATFKRMQANFPEILFVFSFAAPSCVVQKFESNGFLVFEDSSRAVRALAALSYFSKSFAESGPLDIETPVANDDTVTALQTGTQSDVSNEYLAKKLLAQAGIPIISERIARDLSEVSLVFNEINRNIALKIISPDIPHKTEVQGVALNITSAIEAESCAEKMLARVLELRPDARIEGFLLAPMCEAGLETICGAYQDAIFGPVILFGLGGTYVEVLNDVVLRLAPFDVHVARKMISEIRGSEILHEFRGRGAVDVESLALTLSALSWFAHLNKGWIAEIDINPLVVLGENKGAYALDALIHTKKKITPLFE